MPEIDCTPAELFNISITDIYTSNGNISSEVGYGFPEEDSNRTTVGKDTFNGSGYAPSSEDLILERIEHVLYTYVIVGICAFGLLGNVLNLIVLTSKGLQKTMDRMEKSAHCGLVAMAVSDMCFCLGMWTVLAHFPNYVSYCSKRREFLFFNGIPFVTSNFFPCALETKGDVRGNCSLFHSSLCGISWHAPKASESWVFHCHGPSNEFLELLRWPRHHIFKNSDAKTYRRHEVNAQKFQKPFPTKY